MFSQLTEEQKSMRKTLRQFVAREVSPTVRAMDEDKEYPLGLMKRCSELNLPGILIPEEYGGIGLGLTEFCLALEEISCATQTLAITLDASVTLCFLPILIAGTEEQRQTYMPRVLTGQIGAFSMSESVGATNYPAHTATAVRDGDGWILNGTKIFCTNSQVADVYLFFGRVDGNPRPTCFIVEKGMPGLTFGNIEKKLGWHGSNTGTVYFDNVRVPAGNLLGDLHKGLIAAYPAICESCVGIGAMCVGAAAGVLRKTLDYVKNRNLLGRQLIDIQSVSDSLARMAMDIEVSRALVYKTAGLIDSGQIPQIGAPITFMTSACKVTPPEMAARVCDMAIQLHGGHGYMDEMDIHRYWRDVRACQIGEGPTYYHLDAMTAILRKYELF